MLRATYQGNAPVLLVIRKKKRNYSFNLSVGNLKFRKKYIPSNFILCSFLLRTLQIFFEFFLTLNFLILNHNIFIQLISVFKFVKQPVTF